MLTCFVSLLLPVIAAASPPDEFDLDISRLALPEALDQLKLQTDAQFIVFDDLPAAHTDPLKGRFSIEAALLRLLARTGITYERVNDHTFWLKRTTSDLTLANSRPENSLGSPTESTQLARSDSTTHEIVVTGSRLSDHPDTAAPVRIYSRQNIEDLGAASIGELLKYISQQTYAVEGRYSNGAQYAELRGLGPGATAVLINGRRVAPAAAEWAETFDLSVIPLSAIDHVEVILDPASGASGANGGGGTINVILKKQISTPSVELRYGAADGGGVEQRAVVATDIETSVWLGALVLEYFDRAPLLGIERDRWNDQNFRRFGSNDFRVTASNPGNIYSRSGLPLPGLTSSYAAIASIPADGGNQSGFVAMPEHINRESLSKYYSVRPAVERGSAVFSGELNLPNLTPFVELLCVGRKITEQISPPSLSAVLVPAANAFNPFGVDVEADALLANLEPRLTVTRSGLLREVLGVRNDQAKWEWELSVARSVEQGSITLLNDLDPNLVTEALAQPDPNLALNVFRPAPAGSSQLLSSLKSGSYLIPFFHKGTLISASLKGPLDTLIGELPAQLGVEWEQRAAFFKQPPIFRRQTSAAFAQLNVPVRANMRFTTAGRLDHVDGFGMAFNPMYGFAWKPRSQISLDASYGTSSRPPSIADLTRRRTQSRVAVVDPLRDYAVGVVTLVSGGNADLEPTIAQTWTAGITYASPESPLQLSAKYWRINVKNRVTWPTIDQLFEFHSLLGNRITRSQPTLADLENGFPGALQSLDISRINSGALETSGTDLAASRSLETNIGQFDTDVQVTLTDRYATATVKGGQPADRAGIANPSGSVPAWHAIWFIRWAYAFAELQVVGRYIPMYEDFGVSPTGRNIPAQALLDAQITIDMDRFALGSTLLPRSKIALGAQNLFDYEPPFAEVGGWDGFDRSQGDLQQRFIYLRLLYEFE